MKALVIAGGIPQIYLLNQLKLRNIDTVLIDGSDGCVAKPYCDKFYKVNIFDTEEVKKIAIDEKVDFVITVCADQVLLVVAQVSEALGLPCYIDYETGKDVSDKLRMKKIFMDNGVPTSKYLEMDHLDLELINTLKYPLVVKPVDAYSSRGVRRCDNLEELKVFYKEAEEISRTHGVIVEEFVTGEEISVDCFIVDGKANLLLISNSDKILDDGRFVIFRGKTPANISDTVREKVKVVAQQITDAFNLKNSPLLIQMLVKDDDVSVLEFCARTGGNTKYLLIKNATGVDVINATIDLFLGNTPDISFKNTGNKYVLNDFIYCIKDKIFDHLEGFDELVEKGIITEYHQIRAKGTKVNGVTSSSDRIATYNIVGSTKEEINSKINTINNSVKIIDNEGNDIMRHDLLREIK